MKPHTRLPGIDLLRGLAAFGIVGCHLTLQPMTSSASALLTFCDFNVALFALLAGFLMPRFSDAASRGSYLLGRLRRLMVPYIIWTVVYVLATILFDVILDGGFDAKFANPRHWLGIVFLGNSATHLWFLVCLLYGQFILVFAEWALQLLTRRASLLLIVAGFAMTFAIVPNGSYFNWYFLRLFALLVTGRGLAGLVGDSRLEHLTLPLGVLTGVLALAYFFFTGVSQIFRDWALAIPLLLFVRSWPGANAPSVVGWRKVAMVIGAASMGVYLVHPLVTRAGSVLCHRFFSAPFSACVVFADWFVACAVTFLLVQLFRRVWKRF